MNSYRTALERIAELQYSEADEPFDDALAIAAKALEHPETDQPEIELCVECARCLELTRDLA